MTMLNSIITQLNRQRLKKIAEFETQPIEIQNQQFSELISIARDTEFGKAHGFGDITTLTQFRENVPVRSYENFFPFIDRILKGEQNILWPTNIDWFAKSSGTTNDRSKFIPVSKEALENCHFRGGRDMLALYVRQYPDSKVYTGRGLVIGGSHQVNQFSSPAKSYYGDLSAVIISNLPLWFQWRKTPPRPVALMSEWEQKIEKMAEITAREDVVSIFGVPTWTVVLIQKILKNNNASSIFEIMAKPGGVFSWCGFFYSL